MNKALLAVTITVLATTAVSQISPGSISDLSADKRLNRILEFMDSKVDTAEERLAQKHFHNWNTSLAPATDPQKRSPGAMKKTGYEFDGRIGSILFRNESLYPVNVYLVHPDSGIVWPSPDLTWTVAGTSSIILSFKGNTATVGSDWGMKLGSSEMRCVGSVSTWNSSEGQFSISTNQFFKN